MMERCKIKPSWLESECETDLREIMTEHISVGLISSLELLIIDGLKRKGFEFDNRIDLENFIKSNCRVVDDLNKKTTTLLR